MTAAFVLCCVVMVSSDKPAEASTHTVAKQCGFTLGSGATRVEQHCYEGHV